MQPDKVRIVVLYHRMLAHALNTEISIEKKQKLYSMSDIYSDAILTAPDDEQEKLREMGRETYQQELTMLMS